MSNNILKQYFSEFMSKYSEELNEARRTRKQIEKKVRKSRLAPDYYNSVKKDTRRNLCYEIVLQIGDWDTIGIRAWYTEEEKKYLRLKKEVTDIWNHDTDGWKSENATLEREIHKVNNARIAREIMMEYAEKWEENNPNMFLLVLICMLMKKMEPCICIWIIFQWLRDMN